jgi:hypothetical protein
MGKQKYLLGENYRFALNTSFLTNLFNTSAKMKTSFIVVTCLTVALLSIGTANLHSRSNGAPAGYANDPSGGSATCTSCHSGTASTPSSSVVSISSNIPANGYVPGATYTVTATVNYPSFSRFGFELSPQFSTGAYAGTMINTSAETQIVSTKYITHTSSGISGTGTKSWSFNWIAPAQGSGTISFYASFLASNSSNSTSGDITYRSAKSYMEAQPCTVTANATAANDSICPQDITIINATGGGTYLWSNGATTSTISASPGVYSVIVTASGCTDTAVVNITALTQAKPGGLITTGVKSTSATVKWTKAPCATGYLIQYRIMGTATWKTITVSDTSSKTIYNLIPQSNYEYQMAALNGTSSTLYTSVKYFTTTCACNLPVLNLGTVTKNTAQFNWIDDSCGVQYKIQYRKLGVITWLTRIIGDTLSTYTATSLSANTSYEYRYRRECNVAGTNYSVWSAIMGFTTPSLRIGDDQEASTPDLLRIIDVMGREVGPDAEGLLIFQYSDGSTRKIIRQR